jgi:opacity protein-like surface antigen
MIRLAVLLLGVSLALFAVPASAEWFGDLYAGGAFTQSADVSLDGTLLGVTGKGKLQGVDFEVSPAIGGRAGYWFENFGLALDVSHFQPNVSSQTVTLRGTISAPLSLSGAIPVPLDHADVQVTAISFDLLIRAPWFASPEFPHGRLQQYFFAGPTVFLTDVSGFNLSESDTSLGVTAGGGLTWLLTTHIGVFGEYRFTHASPEVKSGGVKLETNLNTHHLLAGVTFRF